MKTDLARPRTEGAPGDPDGTLVQNETTTIIESLRSLSDRTEELSRIRVALESVLARNSVFVILFDSSLRVKSHTLPIAKGAADLRDFRTYVGDGLLATIRESITRGGQEPGELMFEGLCEGRTDLDFALYRTQADPPLYALQLGSAPNEKSTSAEFEEIWDKTSDHLADMQRLVSALDGIRRLDPKVNDEALHREIREKRLPELMRLKQKVADPVLSLCLGIIEKNLLDILSPGPSEMPQAVYTRLTPSELQIAEFIRMGKSTKDIADALDIAAKTVENHRNNLREKLGLRNMGVNLRSYLIQLEKGGSSVAGDERPDPDRG